MGLSVVHGIVKAHDAAIDGREPGGRRHDVSSVLPGRGGTAAEAAPTPAGETRGHGEHVLCVDDEEAIVDVATRC